MSPSKLLDVVVDRVSELLEQRIGLRTEPTVRGRLKRSIRDEAAARGLDLEPYLHTVAARGPAFQSLLNRITVQETSFFRHPEHFEVLARDVLPTLAPPVRIWSAGCANGQEAFSLAMVLQEQGIDGSVIATDLSTDALRRTAAARYTAREMTGLSAARTARHLTATGPGWEINKPLRARVATLRHNLIDAVPDPARSCQVVFCRNVLIYISHEHARAFLERVADTVAPAALFLGSAETMWSVSDRFDAIQVGDTFIYRRRPRAGAVHVGRTPAALSSTRDGPDRGAVPAATRGTVTRGTATRGTATRRTATRRTGARRTAEGSGRAGSSRATRQGSAGPPARDNDSVAATLLASVGEQALAAGDHRSAVVSFRKWACLAPDDALAHLHLGLALEAAGAGAAARRAFEAARRAVIEAGPARAEHTIEGYTAAEFLRLLDAKQQPSAP
jgi:chemotaxis protein methyltransferase CheR